MKVLQKLRIERFLHELYTKGKLFLAFVIVELHRPRERNVQSQVCAESLFKPCVFTTTTVLIDG